MLVDRFKSYNKNGISKVFHPADTLISVVRHLRHYDPTLLRGIQYTPTSPEDIMSIVPVIGVFGGPKWMRTTGEFCTSGKGYDLDQAYCSGLMEFAERYQVKKSLNDSVAFYEPELTMFDVMHVPLASLHMFAHIGDEIRALKSIDPDKLMKFECKWYKCFDLDDNEIYIPMNIVRRVFQGTNGMSAGNTLEEAVLHGMCEVIERHCKTLVEFDKYYEAPEINQDTIKSDVIKDLLFKLKMYGTYVYLKDCSLGIGIPVVAAIRKISNDDYVICYGCSPSREEAMMRAILEVVQTGAVPDLYLKRDTINRHYENVNYIDYDELPDLSSNNILTEIEQINKRLLLQNMNVYYMNCTIPGIDIPSVYVYIKNTRFNRRMFYKNYENMDSDIVKSYVDAVSKGRSDY